MELEVYKISGEKTDKKVQLNDTVFGITPNEHAIYLDVKQHLASRRQGTHKAKEKSEITGSTRKLKRQKGTGTARAGSIKSPVFRGGGRAFGPRPRNYFFKLNKKIKRLARRSALSYKAQNNGITILEDFHFDTPKTRNFLQLLSGFQLLQSRILLVVPEMDQNLYLAQRNLKKARVLTADSINTYEILKSGRLMILESSLPLIEKVLSNDSVVVNA